MNLRTYQAENMAKALEMVKRDLGPDAVILHTRAHRQGGFLGFGGRNMIEITASTDVNVAPRNNRSRKSQASPQARTSDPQPNNKPIDRQALLRKLYADPSLPHITPQVVKQQTAASENGYGKAHTHAPQTATAELNIPTPQKQQSNVEPVPDAQLSRELKQIRQMVRTIMDQKPTSPFANLPEQLFNEYLALLEKQVAEELAQEVIASVQNELSMEEISDAKRLQECISEHIAKLIPASASSKPRKHSTGKPWTIVLIGPTGVGKTTTIAKLAANFKLRDQLKVELITVDTYRIAAVDQLRTYANIIGLPVHVVLTPMELSGAIQRCRDADVVLIDTAGRSQRDVEKMKELNAFVDAANPDEVHLVLSSTCSQPVMMEAVERFSAIRTDSVIFTKLDEAVSLGVLLNVMRQVDKQLSYITMGQEVPHQIERGSGSRLAKMIIGAHSESTG